MGGTKTEGGCTNVHVTYDQVVVLFKSPVRSVKFELPCFDFPLDYGSIKWFFYVPPPFFFCFKIIIHAQGLRILSGEDDVDMS